MFMKLFFLFTVIPFFEIYILIKVGNHFGFFTTLSIIIVTGLVGAHFVRQEGFKVWLKIQNEMRNGNFPADQLVEGLLLFVAGVILVTPGLLTDIMGFLLLVPFIRKYIREWVNQKFSDMIRRGDIRFIGLM